MEVFNPTFTLGKLISLGYITQNEGSSILLCWPHRFLFYDQFKCHFNAHLR